jgi:predicted nucleic acid-binding protein
MSTRLFDASAIIMLAKRYPDKASATLEGECLLDLTFYEVGNAFWKINKLIGKSDKETALAAINEASLLMAQMGAIRVEEGDLKDVMEIAFDTSLSFYDSAYLYVARRRNLVLVTEDEGLLRNSDKVGVRCLKVKDLISTP